MNYPFPVVTANADGSLKSQIQYTAFGEIRASLGITDSEYRYTGQLRQAELGLYYYVARWYDPYLNRFAQADSIIPLQTQGTQAWDRYAYVNNNPLRYTDPSGHYACLDYGFCFPDSSPGNAQKIGQNTNSSLSDKEYKENKSSDASLINVHRSPCELISSNLTCHKVSRVLGTTSLALDIAALGLSVAGIDIELIGLGGGAVGTGTKQHSVYVQICVRRAGKPFTTFFVKYVSVTQRKF